jgi:chemotaxis response regulator CheB
VPQRDDLFQSRLQERTHQLFYDSLGMFGILGLGSRETLRFMPQEHLYEPLVACREALSADGMKTPELVAIGTSLGGSKALTALLAVLPERFPVPIVVVQAPHDLARRRGLNPGCCRSTPA